MRIFALAVFFTLHLVAAIPSMSRPPLPKSKLDALPQVGAYFFGGWAGKKYVTDTTQTWAKNAPTHLTRRMVEEFSGREPVWGWRDDTQSIMDQEIDLAADNGLTFFSFCWYYREQKTKIDTNAIKADPLNLALQFFRKAKNRKRMKYCLMIANHPGAEIKGTQAWKQAADYWMQFFTDPEYLRVDGKPLVVVFQARGADHEGLKYLQEKARSLGFTGVAVAGCGGAENDTAFSYITNYNIHRGLGPTGQHAYTELMDLNRKKWVGSPKQPRIPVVTSGWDRRPWEGPNGMTKDIEWFYPDRTPELFQKSLSESFQWMNRNPEQTTKERIVLVYAWNELGEGGYIIPTRETPEPLYLHAIKRALKSEAGGISAPRIR